MAGEISSGRSTAIRLDSLARTASYEELTDAFQQVGAQAERSLAELGTTRQARQTKNMSALTMSYHALTSKVSTDMARKLRNKSGQVLLPQGTDVTRWAQSAVKSVTKQETIHYHTAQDDAVHAGRIVQSSVERLVTATQTLADPASEPST